MMSWYEIIKQQWQWGCYTDPSQLDIYVQVGWITEEQKEEIVHSTDAPEEDEPVEDYPESESTEGEPTEDNSATNA